MHWGYFSKSLKPVVEVDSGDFVTIETLTHHANDDAERMVKGDPGAESVFYWDDSSKGVNRRGAGPMDASLFGRGAGEGLGVHICTGPVAVSGAEPGDILEVRILDVAPRPCANPEYAGKSFGSNAAAWWGFHYNDLIEEPKPREVITIYEVDAAGATSWAQALYNFRWMPQTDPFGVVHKIIDYPGVPVDHSHGQGELRRAQERARPDPAALRRDGAGAGRGRHRRLDPAELHRRQHRQLAHRQGRDDVLPGRGAGRAALGRRSARLAGRLRAVRHRDRVLADRHLPARSCTRRQRSPGTALESLDYPLLETQDEFVVHGFSFPNYLAELGPEAQSEIYGKSSIDLALRDAFRKMRHFLMNTQGLTEDEAISLMSVGVDFGVTQVVDGNWGVHAIVKKSLFAGAA